MKALYDEKRQIWSIDEANKYIITSAKNRIVHELRMATNNLRGHSWFLYTLIASGLSRHPTFCTHIIEIPHYQVRLLYSSILRQIPLLKY